MKGLWLVYEPGEVARNRFFIDRWEDAARARGVPLWLVTADRLQTGIEDGAPVIRHLDGHPLPDACVMRLNRPLLTEQFERLGVPAFNGSRIARVCNDKRLTHLTLSGLAPMMDTVFLQGDETDSPFPYPVVVKSAHGSGGRQVYRADDGPSFRAALAAIRPDGALAQPMSDTPGKDVRAYVLGKEIVRVMMRRSDHDFRSNLNQGGDAVPWTLRAAEEKWVRDIAGAFDFGLAGVDFILHRGQLLFNEVEDAVGTRMLYASGYDVVPDYLALILKRLEKR